MKPNRITVKFFVAPDPGTSVDLAPFIPLFHRVIQEQGVEGLLIDVADYSHVPDGPGIILIGHDVDYGMDLTGGRAGLLVTAKRNQSEDLGELLRITLRRALVAMRVVEADTGAGVVFDTAVVEVRVLDRLMVSGSADADFEQLRAVVETLLRDLYTGSEFDLQRAPAGDARQAVGLRLEAGAPLDSDAAIEQLGGSQLGVPPGTVPQSDWDITVEELKRLRDESEDLVLVDVREPDEYEVCNLGGQLIPVGDLPDRLGELDKSARVVVHCKLGGRGAAAVKALRAEGFEDAWNLRGGILEWIQRIDPSLPRY